MSNSAIDFFNITADSELEKLQEVILQNKTIQADKIVQAIAQDVTNGIALCPVHFTLYVAQNELLARKDLQELIKILGAGMTSFLTRDPDIFLSYAKAASICARKL